MALGDEAAAYVDTIKGKQELTIQARRQFRIADVPFSVLGGVLLNDRFLERLSPGTSVMVLLRFGGEVMGMPDVKSISEIKDGKILINDREYRAAPVDVPMAGDGEAPMLLVVLRE